MWFLNFVLLLQLQTPPAPIKVVVGLTDGKQVVVENPEFVGIIQGQNADAVLTYRVSKTHGRMPLQSISKIEFGKYTTGKPFLLTITLKNGQKLDVESEHTNYLTIRGRTDLGVVTIKHPDPISAPTKLTTHRPNRSADLTIQYLEFPASSE